MMNKLKLKVQLDDQLKPVGLYSVDMTLTEFADQLDTFGGMLRAVFEIEILQGSQTRHPDGSVQYCFATDIEKAAHLRQALTLAFFPPPTN